MVSDDLGVDPDRLEHCTVYPSCRRVVLIVTWRYCLLYLYLRER
jgi:hypothetical protein